MLAETIDSWTRQWKQEGRQEGRQEGLQEGLQQGLQTGELLLLQRQLTKRFGPLPAPILERLQQATLAELETWGERVLEARSLEEVFEDSSALGH